MTSKLSKIVNDLNGSNLKVETNSKRATQQRNRILDEATRKRRSRQQLAQLERDNFHDDPHANLVMHKKAPKFDDSIANQNNGSGSRKSTSHTRIRTLTLQAMIEEDIRLSPQVNYMNAAAPSPSCVQVLRNPLPITLKPLFESGKLADSNINEPKNFFETQQSVNSKTEDTSAENSISEIFELPPPEKKKKRLEHNDSNLDFQSLDLSKRTILILHRRHFCCVCGFQAAYTCVVCGMRYCCVNCLQTHKDTRCLKWTA